MCFISCTPSDDDKTPVIFSSFNEGTMSARIFELKVDSTFRFWRDVGFKEDEVNGTWRLVNDTFNLYTRQIEMQKVGRLYVQKKFWMGYPFISRNFDA